jgi:hypothetical protein
MVKVPDYEIIAVLVWQAEEGISSLLAAGDFVDFLGLVLSAGL